MRRRGYLGVGIAAILVGGLAGWLLAEHPWSTPPETAPSAAATAPKAANPAPKEAEASPSFDIVRVGPDGRAVIAGRAAPGAEVTVLDHGKELGKTTADSTGQWVLLPDQPLPPGARELSLSARTPDGKTASSDSTVAILVPERQEQTPASGAVAVLLPKGDAAARTMQAGGIANRVGLDIVEYDASGGTQLSGQADPGARVTIAINGRAVDTAATDGTGRWSARLSQEVPVGRYTLRLDALTADNKVAGTLSLTLRRAAPGELGGGDYFAVVPGNTLWHLASRSFGEGFRYVELYRANQAQINNPDLIYPGQLLAVPAKD